jgi:hypothetical protein
VKLASIFISLALMTKPAMSTVPTFEPVGQKGGRFSRIDVSGPSCETLDIALQDQSVVAAEIWSSERLRVGGARIVSADGEAFDFERGAERQMTFRRELRAGSYRLEISGYGAGAYRGWITLPRSGSLTKPGVWILSFSVLAR